MSEEVMGAEHAKAARDAASAYVQALPKNKAQIRKLLELAFHSGTSAEESANAVQRARVLMDKDNIQITDLMRADWGGGPLVSALNECGHVVMVAGKYRGKCLAEIVDIDPTYILGIKASNDWREGPILAAVIRVARAYESELICRYTGQWGDDSLWDEHLMGDEEDEPDAVSDNG